VTYRFGVEEYPTLVAAALAAQHFCVNELESAKFGEIIAPDGTRWPLVVHVSLGAPYTSAETAEEAAYRRDARF
jgi:hypothetical protein